MSTSTIERVVAPTPSLASLSESAEQLDPLLRRHSRYVAGAGRFTLVWFALFVLFASQQQAGAEALVGVSMAAVAWVVALGGACASSRPALCSAVPRLIGTALGLGVVAVLNPTFVGLHLPAVWLGGCAVAVFCSVGVWDQVVTRVFARHERVLLVGSDDVDALLTPAADDCLAAFDVVGAIAGAENLAEIVRDQQPDVVVLTDAAVYDTALDRLLDARANVRVTGLTSFWEYAFGRVPIEQITPAWFMSLLHPRQRVYTRFAKRGFDLVVAIVGLVAVIPLLAFLAVVLKATSGQALYRQTRVGEGGRQFTVYKLRTMGCDAEKDGAAFSCADDPRATRIGCVLRRTHLDELPQLWNVVKGDMSIVGPRPERPEFIRELEATVPFWNRRLLVKPGVTGWAQLRCGYASDRAAMAEKLSYDLWYLRNGSLAVDVAICLRTVGHLVRALVRRRAPAEEGADGESPRQGPRGRGNGDRERLHSSGFGGASLGRSRTATLATSAASQRTVRDAT